VKKANRRGRQKESCTAAALLALLCADGAAMAQTAPPTGPVPAAAPGMGDIVITARRREERLQQVPIAVSAVSGRSLAGAGVAQSRDLTLVMPSLVFSKANASFQPYIRGVGTRNTNVGDESSVSVYVDGIYQPVMASLGMDLLKVDRIEVLRGPQGTLFGRNSAGGLINIVTRDPKFEPQGEFSVEGGNYGQRSVKMYATTGITDKLAIDFNGLYKADDGYLRDLVRSRRTGALTSEAIRVKLLWQADDSFKATLAAGASRAVDGYALSNQPLNGNSQGLRPPVPPVVATKPWTVALNGEPFGVSSQKFVWMKLAKEMSGLSIESSSSYSNDYAESNTDQDGTTKLMTEVSTPARSKYFTQELRAVSNGDGKFQYIFGTYYLNGVAKFIPATVRNNAQVVSRTFSIQNVESIAGFGEGNYDITDAIQITAGARYTHEKRYYQATVYNAAGVVSSLVPKRDTSFDEFTYRLALLVKATDRLNFYGSYSRGFKSGVFNGFATTVATSAPTRPEILDAFEVGVKSDPAPWLRVNVSAFYYDYKDQQLSARTPGASVAVLFNAAKSKIKGGEIEATVIPVDRLNIRLTGSYLDAQYDSFPAAQVFVPSGIGGNISIAPYDASGKDMIRAPRYTLSANFQYTIPTSAGEFGISGNVYRSAKYYWEATNRLVQPAYTMLNAELSWSPSDALRLSIWGRNLTNAVVYRQITLDANADLAAFDPPRAYGGRMTITF
jgi:iron complex outermembrane receptor protein